MEVGFLLSDPPVASLEDYLALAERLRRET